MVKYIIKRILLALLILFGVSMILYFLVRLMPDNYLYEKISPNSLDPEGDLKRLKEFYGMADNSFMGILKGYFSWFFKFLGGDFGNSFVKDQPVKEIIFQNMPLSFTLSFVSLILQLVISIPLGIKCACNQYGKLDYAATILTMIGISFPSFFFGGIVIKIFAVEFQWFPSGGVPPIDPSVTKFEYYLDYARSLVLPIFVLTILSIGSMMRYTRTNTLEVLNADYIRTARAKGLSENKVVYKHVFRNTLIPLVTTLAGILPGLFGGSMITETVFDLPGIGQAAYNAFLDGDIPLIMGYNMFIAILTVIGILLTDLMYAVVDPRVKLGK